MKNFLSRSSSTRALGLLLALGITLGATACDDDDNDDGITGLDPNRSFTQVERLGNPLINEVIFPKRDHGLHNSKSPFEDPLPMTSGGSDVPGHIRAFVSSFPNRTEKTITTLQTVFSKDMLMTFPNRAPAEAGWLTYALKPGVGYGGRKLSDDVLDTALMAIFGNLLDPAQPVLAGLTSDNVGPSVRQFSATFPYLEAPR